MTALCPEVMEAFLGLQYVVNSLLCMYYSFFLTLPSLAAFRIPTQYIQSLGVEGPLVSSSVFTTCAVLKTVEEFLILCRCLCMFCAYM